MLRSVLWERLKDAVEDEKEERVESCGRFNSRECIVEAESDVLIWVDSHSTITTISINTHMLSIHFALSLMSLFQKVWYPSFSE